MELITNLATKEFIGGRFLGDILFDPNNPITDTYYWDDTNLDREGLKLTFPKTMCITKIVLYSTNTYPLGNVKFELDNKVIYQQQNVSRTEPMIFDGCICGKKLEIMRYVIKDSVFAKILVYGFTPKVLIKQDSKYFSIKKEFYNEKISEFVPLDDNIEINKETIRNYGFDDIKDLYNFNINNTNIKPIEKFNNFQIISDTSFNITVNGIKTYKDLVIGKNSFSTRTSKNIDYFKLKDSSDDIKIIFSINKGKSWKTFINNNFEDLPININNKEDIINWNNIISIIDEKGIVSNQLDKINFNNLEFNNIRFAYLLYAKDINTISKMKEIIWQFDSNGILELCDKNEIKIQLFQDGVKLISNIDCSMIKTNITYEGIEK